MAHIDRRKKIIQAKLVYYGPGLCGKTANLEYINRNLCKGEELMSLATEGDRTIFFDFMPLEADSVAGMKVSFRLYTVPGQVRYGATRKMVLKNVDGVVFVADSQAMMLDSNVESLEDLFGNLRELGIPADDIDLVLQYNKRDLPEVLPREELDQALNDKGYPVFLSSALTGQGVLETLRHAARLVLRRIARDLKEEAEPENVPAAAGPAGGAPTPSLPESPTRAAPRMGAEPPTPPPILPAARSPALPAQAARKDGAAAAVPPSASATNVPAAAPPTGSRAAPAPVPRELATKADAAPGAEPPTPLPAPIPAKSTGTARVPAKQGTAAATMPSPGRLPTVPPVAASPGLLRTPAPLPIPPAVKSEARQPAELPTPPPTRRPTIPGVPAQGTQDSGAAAAPPARSPAEPPAIVQPTEPPALPPLPAAAAGWPARAPQKSGTASLAAFLSRSGPGSVPAAAAPSTPTPPSATVPQADSPAPPADTVVVPVPDAASTKAAARPPADGSFAATVLAIPPVAGPAPSGPSGAAPNADALAGLERRLDAISGVVGAASSMQEQLRSEVTRLRDLATQLVNSSSAGKEELARLRNEVATLARKDDIVALHKELAARTDEAKGHRDGIAAALCKELEALPSMEDLGVLRSELATLVEKAQSDRAALDAQARNKDLELLPSKEDMARLRGDMARLAESVLDGAGAVDPAVLRQELAALPTRQELVALTTLVERVAAEVADLRNRAPQAPVEFHPSPVVRTPSSEARGSSEPRAEERAMEEGAAAPAPSVAESPPKAEETQPEEVQGGPDKGAPDVATVKPDDRPLDEAVPEAPQPAAAEPQPEDTPVSAASPAEETQVRMEEAEPGPAQQQVAKAEEPPTFDNQPEHLNAARVARVMVADLNLYHRTEVEEGIKAGDLYQRIKETLDDMKVTYASRISEEIRNQKDYLTDELEKMIAKKRKSLGLE